GEVGGTAGAAGPASHAFGVDEHTNSAHQYVAWLLPGIRIDRAGGCGTRYRPDRPLPGRRALRPASDPARLDAAHARGDPPDGSAHPTAGTGTRTTGPAKPRLPGAHQRPGHRIAYQH